MPQPNPELLTPFAILQRPFLEPEKPATHRINLNEPLAVIYQSPRKFHTMVQDPPMSIRVRLGGNPYFDTNGKVYELIGNIDLEREANPSQSWHLTQTCTGLEVYTTLEGNPRSVLLTKRQKRLTEDGRYYKLLLADFVLKRKRDHFGPIHREDINYDKSRSFGSGFFENPWDAANVLASLNEAVVSARTRLIQAAS